MRYFFIFLVVAVVVGAAIFSIHLFFSKDDLAECESRPTTGECAPGGAIIVVSGGDTLARTDEAVELYKKGWADYLVVSGAAKDTEGPSNAEVMYSYAVKNGVPPSDISIDTMAENTKENAEGAEQLAKSRGVEDVIVVTSPYHIPRAKILFERKFAEVRAHPSTNDKNWSGTWWLSTHGWRLAVSEIVKYTLEKTRAGTAYEPPY